MERGRSIERLAGLPPAARPGRACLALAALLAAALGGCTSFRTATPTLGGDYGGEAEAPRAAGAPGKAAPAAGTAAPSLTAAPESAPAGGGPAASAGQAPSPAGEPGQEPSQARKRVYSGFGRLLVDDPQESKKRIAAIAVGAGGYVEASYELRILVRVPAARFEELFQQILDLGEVLNKAVQTQDVTEEFTDLQARIRVAEKTRERLYALLERTDNVEQRLKILREIRRLTEEIEKIRLTLDLLERRVAFSRLSVELVPRLEQEQARRREIPFPWIAGLNPIRPTLGELRGRLELSLGEEFAVFEGQRIFLAESPEGTQVRAGSVPNHPRGDAAFWQKALMVHLGGLYRSARPMEIGALRAVLFTSKDRTPYSYLVGVVSGAEDLLVVEVFFPDSDAVQRRLPGVRAALEGMRADRMNVDQGAR